MAMKSLKILFLCHHPKGVGTYIRAYSLARSLSIKGHTVTLVGISSDLRFKQKIKTCSNLKIVFNPNLLNGGFLMSRIASSKGWGILDIYHRIVDIKRHKYDIIQMFDHFPNISIPFQYLRNKSDAKFVSDWCDIYHLSGGFRDTFRHRFDPAYRLLGFVFRKYLKRMELQIRKQSDYVSVISRKLKSDAINYGIVGEKIIVVEGGVDIKKIRPLEKEYSRKKIGFSQKDKIIIFLGRSQFDLDLLIKSFAKIQNNVQNSFLVVVGQNLHSWTKELADRLGIKDRYLEVGYIPDNILPYYLSSADIFALPLKKNLINETRWPNKIGEYMASGRPTIVSNVGDIPGIVKKYQIGLVADNSAEDFSIKLLKLLNNEKLSDILGKNARKLALKKFSWLKMASKLEDAYFKLSQR
jgi:glycosyltransferase involved in cell wall biosynthesis